MYLVLDEHINSSNLPTISYEAFTFSGGEPHIRIQDEVAPNTEVTILHRITSFNDLGLLAVAVNALRNLRIENIKLVLPYFPAARQDRVMTQGEPLTIKLYADLINSMNFNEITIFDPHSDVAPALINNCTIIDNIPFIQKVIKHIGSDTVLVSPDAGALKKTYKLAKALQQEHVIECSKQREVLTGALSGFKVYSEDLGGKDCLITDDICDGGRTFIGLAKELKAKNVGKLYLAVSHGIFSHGFDALLEHYDMIFTTNSFKNIEQTERIIEIDFFKLI